MATTGLTTGIRFAPSVAIGTDTAYRLSTGFTAIAFAAAGIATLSRAPAIMGSLAHLGYPPYFATIIGVWELLGATAIVVPPVPRLREWAYVGMFFDLTGAAVSYAMSGDPLGKILAPMLLLGIVAISWASQPSSGVPDPD